MTGGVDSESKLFAKNFRLSLRQCLLGLRPQIATLDRVLQMKTKGDFGQSEELFVDALRDLNTLVLLLDPPINKAGSDTFTQQASKVREA